MHSGRLEEQTEEPSCSFTVLSDFTHILHCEAQTVEQEKIVDWKVINYSVIINSSFTRFSKKRKY